MLVRNAIFDCPDQGIAKSRLFSQSARVPWRSLDYMVATSTVSGLFLDALARGFTFASSGFSSFFFPFSGFFFFSFLASITFSGSSACCGSIDFSSAMLASPKRCAQSSSTAWLNTSPMSTLSISPSISSFFPAAALVRIFSLIRPAFFCSFRRSR